MIKLYTIHCPQCNVLKKKLDAKGIQYELVDDTVLLGQLGIEVFPILEVDGERMMMRPAVDWVAAQ